MKLANETGDPQFLGGVKPTATHSGLAWSDMALGVTLALPAVGGIIGLVIWIWRS